MYVQYKCYLESLKHIEIVNKMADLVTNDTLKYIVAPVTFSHMTIYSEANELHLFSNDYKQGAEPCEIIDLPKREDELLVLEYCRRYNKICNDF